ncbi:MAG: hypothetical protein Q8P44_04175 [Dehalococcoidia bacterium]|nr:hypothetical protein [Dehalococcoidia bacterium]
MFWKKKHVEEDNLKSSSTAVVEKPIEKGKKLPGPKDIPEMLGRYLVVTLKQEPDWVWQLKAVLKPRPEGKDSFDFRVFHLLHASAKNIKIIDYHTFDKYPELVLYQGNLDKKTWKVQMETKKA